MNAGIPSVPPALLAQRAVASLRGEPGRSDGWRFQMEWTRAVAAGRHDEQNHSLHTEAGKKDARYLARIAFRAFVHGVLPTEIQWSHFESKLTAVYTELNE